MTGVRRRLTGRLDVALPPHEAFRLFTARGEEEWVPGWQPRFPVPTVDDTEPGVVFETEAHGQVTTWAVVACDPGRSIRYARATPGVRAGTVTVTLRAVGSTSAQVEVTYDLTAFAAAAAAELQTFADGYAEFLASWERQIAAVTMTSADADGT